MNTQATVTHAQAAVAHRTAADAQGQPDARTKSEAATHATYQTTAAKGWRGPHQDNLQAVRTRRFADKAAEAINPIEAAEWHRKAANAHERTRRPQFKNGIRRTAPLANEVEILKRRQAKVGQMLK